MLITPATRLTALLIVEGPLTFRAIIAAREAREPPDPSARASRSRGSGGVILNIG